FFFFFFSSRRRHTRSKRDWSSDVCSSDLVVQNGFSGAISFITSLPGKALQWGKDFIQGLINGIKSMVQAVVDTVSGIASRIASFLHFSAPDEGPLSDYEKWTPDFMKGVADRKSTRLNSSHVSISYAVF